ncbi:tetratricopeptide repeat protein [Mucilaginibacter sp. BT774]|uniref:tetratricopeptide repeat protein n=1 Tax=Mucilaginibacter sp. BT774 TaxID=3062276 RepID=UPI002675D244|nr:tetratricopeptide repeat protein [Mucilaginibacter sp. BT774]MDO3626834.1 tetratricopeptide repeat protein [Mucilaginibacter sp. BT774]
MRYGLGIVLGLMVLPGLVFAQKNKPANGNRVVMVVGRPMTADDSLMVRQLFFSALREKTVENFTLATEEFNQILSMDPQNDATLFELANLAKLKNNYSDARDFLEKAVTVKPDNQWYWVALADCYEKNNEIDKLENVFNELIRIDPDKVDYYYDKANVYFLQKRYDDALGVYKQIEEISGITDDLVAKRQAIYLKQGRVDQAAADMEAMIAANPTQVRYYLFLAEVYNSNGLQDKALATLQSAEKIDPNNGQVHLALADIYRDKKDNEHSYNELTAAFTVSDLDIDQKLKIVLNYVPKFPDANAKASALELSRLLTVAHPDDSRAFALYADMLLQNGKYKEAKENYKKSVQMNGQVYEVREQLIRLELGDNDIDGALKDGQDALSLFPNQAWLNYLVGVAYQQKKDFKKAVEYVKNASELETQDKELLSQAYSSLGDCYHSLNDLTKSDQSYEKALTYNPDNSYTLNNYAYYLSIRGIQLDKAAEMSKHSNELQPGTASFEDTYAWILFKQKKYAEAKTWMEKALVHNNKDNSPVQYEHYGDIMFQLGDINTALQNWKKAKDNGGGSPILERKINEKKYVE